MSTWNILKFSKPPANSDLGYLTTYKLEYLYSFLGNKTIQNKIEELKPKATMGIRLEEFVLGKDVMGFYDRGPLYCLSLMLDWFSDKATIDYLFNKLSDYTEENYMKNTPWSSSRIKIINGLIESYESRNYYQPSVSNLNKIATLKKHLTYNYYFSDYHFFLISIYRKLLILGDEGFQSKLNSIILLEYPQKLEGIKKSLIDLNIWIEQGLGNGVLTALERYCENSGQIPRYKDFFKQAADNNWRF